jgi:hypothetical protein
MWIVTADRLPDLEGEPVTVLGYWESLRNSMDAYGVAHWDGFTWTADDAELLFTGPSHWMHLPIPPERE